MNTTNRGILIRAPRSTDYILGGVGSIAPPFSIGDMIPYLPDFENQSDSLTDFLCCVTESELHDIETICTYFWRNNMCSDEFKNFLTQHGYIQNNKVKFSVRFSAKMNGTDITMGQYQTVAGDSTRAVGLAPDTLWQTNAFMNFNDYYTPPPLSLQTLAQQILWFITINYQGVPQTGLSEALKALPVQVATEVCPGWDSGAVVPKCSGQPIQHCTMLYGQDDQGNWLDFDSYKPWLQSLASDYELNYNLQYIVTLKPLMLRQGMNGMDVETLQQKLNSLGYLLTTDGSFGPLTKAGVIDFQTKNGLTPDGIVGPLTLDKIQTLLSDKEASSLPGIITAVCVSEGVEPELALAVAGCEGGMNPHAINKNNNGSIDRGLYQFNNEYHPEITDEMAFDPAQATKLFCAAVKNKELHIFWSASQHCWGPKVAPAILAKYGIS